MHSPRILLAAPSSGSGKTTITCGILKVLKERGRRVVSFKCGPDYIDPMFQQSVLGVPSGTLDLFFCDRDLLLTLYGRNAKNADCAVVEGVMGYYDGLGAASVEASTYRVAQTLRAPVVLIVNARGQSVSALATLDGFLRFKPDSRIRGVIFNQMSKPVFDALAPEVRKRGVVPIGYLPKAADLVIESRHLGLVTPDAVDDLDARLERLAAKLQETLDFDALEAMMREAEDLAIPAECEALNMPKTRVAVASDEAFCFLYRDNLALLKRYGAELLFFSPLHDAAIPDGAQGLILPGGYPELFCRALSENASMRESVRHAIEHGMPCLAECGGFLYLHRELEDMDGTFYPMCGVLDARAVRTDTLSRFGYITLTAQTDGAFFRQGERIRAHEFHYYESEDCGSDMTATKPQSKRSWNAVHSEGTLCMGFPHLFYESNPKPIERFLRACAKED